MAQLASKGHELTPISAAQRARAVSARATPPPERELVMARSRVRTRERRLHVQVCGWHVGARPCTEGEGRLDGTVGF